jgi:predicted N-acetyltransferase YhbS
MPAYYQRAPPMAPSWRTRRVLIREMTTADIPAGLALCRASRWNQTEADWRCFLQAAPHGALVAVEGGEVVGSVATLPYGPFAWVSMVLVLPVARGRGIGTQLLERGLALVPAGVVARLDATPAGEPLYRKLGFEAEYGLARMVCSAPGPSPAPTPGLKPRGYHDGKLSVGGMAVRPLTASDWPVIRAIDARVFGASRAGLIERLAIEAPEYAWVAATPRDVVGYVFGRRGHVRDHIGPLVAEDREAAGPLLDACLAQRAERGVFVDVPDAQREWRAALDARGFTIERPFLRMHRGPLADSGQPSQIFAVTGPEFG